jgi:integrase
MRDKITKRAVDALKPGPDGAETMLWDTEVKGFGCRVQRGGSKSYIVHYRVGSGRGAPLRKLTIGKHGAPWTPETARKEARRLLGMIEGGADPAADKIARKEAPTVADLAERFLAEHAEAKRKASTATEYRRLLDRIILPALGKRKVIDITRHDIGKLHHGLRDAPYQANRVLAVLSKMFNLAEQWGLRPDGSNPCRHVEKFGERKRERMLSPAELARLGDALSTHNGSPYAVAAVKLLMFTGARLGEVLGLRWDWIDFDRGEARLPDSKSGAKTLHLPPPALAVLAELPRQDGNLHVIVGHKTGAAMVNLEKPWRAMRASAALDDVRLHDLRHAFASVAASSGMGLPIIGKMLGHTQAATTHRYAHLASDPVKAAAAAVAGKIAAAMGSGSGASGKRVTTVLPLRSRS